MFYDHKMFFIWEIYNVPPTSAIFMTVEQFFAQFSDFQFLKLGEFQDLPDQLPDQFVDQLGGFTKNARYRK